MWNRYKCSNTTFDASEILSYVSDIPLAFSENDVEELFNVYLLMITSNLNVPMVSLMGLEAHLCMIAGNLNIPKTPPSSLECTKKKNDLSNKQKFDFFISFVLKLTTFIK